MKRFSGVVSAAIVIREIKILVLRDGCFAASSG